MTESPISTTAVSSLAYRDEDVAKGVHFDEISILLVEPKPSNGKSVVILELGNGLRIP